MVGTGEMNFAESDLMIYGDLMFDSFDELLDFSSEEEAHMLSEPLPCAPSTSWEEDNDPLLHPPPPPPPPPTTNTTHVDNSLSASDEDATLLCDDLDVAQLEWLSNFVEESFSPSAAPVDLPVTTTTTVEKEGNGSGGHQYRIPSPISVLEQGSGLVALQSTCSPSSSTSSSCSGVLGGGGPKASAPASASALPTPNLGPPEPTARGPRTKRARPTSFSAPNSLIPFTRTDVDEASDNCQKESSSDAKVVVKKKKAKKQKPTADDNNALLLASGAAPPAAAVAEEQQAAPPARRCMHCDVQKTPQWRAGPMGPKTLCNACGVRYKSGRLFPEYRPAASPTFVVSLHSNSHKKVVEMRNKAAPRADDIAPGAPVALKGCELLNYIRVGNGNGIGISKQQHQQ